MTLLLPGVGTFMERREPMRMAQSLLCKATGPISYAYCRPTNLDWRYSHTSKRYEYLNLYSDHADAAAAAADK